MPGIAATVNETAWRQQTRARDGVAGRPGQRPRRRRRRSDAVVASATFSPSR